MALNENKLQRLFSLFLIVISFSLFSATPGDSIHKLYYKLGLKFSAERASWQAISPTPYKVNNGGIQFITGYENSVWSFETGLYNTSKVIENADGKTTYRFLNVPLNLRYSKRGFYLAAGVFADYLILVNTIKSAYDPLDKKRKASVGLNGAVGYEKNITSGLNVFLEGRYFYSSFFGKDRLYFRSYGIAIGLNYKF